MRGYWGLKRTGKRIQDTIKLAAIPAEDNKRIIIKGDFLYSKNKGKIKVRKRSGDPPANIGIISPEEIETAAKMVIEVQFATAKDDLVTQVARIFGFKSTSNKTAKGISEVIENLLSNEILVEMPNGMINLPK